MSEADFKKAVWLVRNGPDNKSSTETRLNFYKYYKQATEGDVTGSQPWAVQMEARAKWDAWNSVKGMSADDARAEYVKLMGDDWESHEAFKDYKE